MDDTVSSLLQAIAAYSFPVQQGDRDQTILVQNSRVEPAKAEELTKQLQMLISENAYLRDALHQQTEATPVLRKSSNRSTSPQPRSPISPVSRGKSGNLRILPGEPTYLTFLQNQVSFLRTALSQSQTPLPTQPVFIVQGEFFLLLKDALSKSLHTISLFLGQLNDQGDSLYQTFQELQGKASSYSVKYAFDATLFEQLMRLVDECEGFKQKVFSVYTGKIEMLSSEMTNLLQESYKIVISLAGSISEESDIHELKSWNERKIEISTEKGTFELLLCKRQMLCDLEALKINLLAKNFGTMPIAAPRIPRCNVKKPATRPLPDPPAMEPQQMLQYISTLMSELTEALNQAKAAVGTWAWRVNVLLPSPMRVCRNMHDLGVTLKASKADIEQITKVSLADKPEIEKRVMRTFREDKLTEEVAEKNAELEEAQQREQLYQACLEQLKSEMDRALDEERGKSFSLEQTIATLDEEKEQLSSSLTIFFTRSEALQSDISAFILRVNTNVFHSEATSLPEIAVLTEELYRVHQESIETVVMESFEPQLLILGHGSKLRGCGSDSEAVWKGMQYLVRAAEQCTERVGAFSQTRELGDEVSAFMMKAMQHYVYEDLKSIEEKLMEEREGRRTAEEEREWLRGERDTLVEEKNELTQHLEATINALRYREAAEAEKAAQLAATTSSLESLKYDYDCEKTARAIETSALTDANLSLSQGIDQLRLQLEDLGRENDILRNQLRVQEIAIYSSEESSEENEVVSKGSGGGMLLRVNKGLNFTVHYLSRLLGRDFEAPEETMQKQAVVYDQLVEVEKLLKEKRELHTEVDRLNEELSRLLETESSLEQMNTRMQQELDRLPLSHKAQIDALTADHLSDTQQLKAAHEKEASDLRREMELLNLQHRQEVSTLMQQISTAQTFIISSEAETKDMSLGKRLQTTSSIEEKLMKGFEYICVRAKEITNNAEEMPKEPIDKQKYLYERLEDIERIITALKRLNEELNDKIASEASSHQEAMAISESRYSTLYYRWESDLRSRDDLINQLRSQVFHMETTLCVELSKTEELPSDEFFRHMRRGDGYSQKVAEGFKFLNEKLAELVPACSPVTGDILESQAEMLRRCSDIQRLVAETKAERSQLAEDLKLYQEKMIAQTSRLESEKCDLQQKIGEQQQMIDKQQQEKASLQTQLAQLTSVIEQKEAQFKKATDDFLKDQNEAKVLNEKLRKRLNEVESLVYISSTTTEDFASVDFTYPRIRGTGYHDKVCKGFKYLNEKLGELIPIEVNHSTHMLENQLRMYKMMVEIQRVIAVAKDEKEKADQEVKVLNGDKEKLNNQISVLFEEKAKEFRSNNLQINKLKEDIEGLKADLKRRDDHIYKLKTSIGDSERQQTILRQSLEDLKKENQNLRTQLGTDLLIAYPTEQMSPNTDETPRKHLQSSGSLENKLDRGFELILELMEQFTLESHEHEGSLLEKQKSVLISTQHLADIIIMSRNAAKGQTLEFSARMDMLKRDKQELQDRLKAAMEQVKKVAEEKERAETLNRNLFEQLDIKELAGGESGPLEVPAETRSHLQAGQTLEEKLSKGFDYSISEISTILGIKVTSPEAMLDKQRMLFDLISMASRQQEDFRRILLQQEDALEKRAGDIVTKQKRKVEELKAIFVHKSHERAGLILALRRELATATHNCAVHSEEMAKLAAKMSSSDCSLSDLQGTNAQLVQRIADLEQESTSNVTLIAEKSRELEKTSEVIAALEAEKSGLEQQITQYENKIFDFEKDMDGLNRAKEESDKLLDEARNESSIEGMKLRELEQYKWNAEKSLRDYEENNKLLQQTILENERKISDLLQTKAELTQQVEEVEKCAELNACAAQTQSEIDGLKASVERYQHALNRIFTDIQATLPEYQCLQNGEFEKDCSVIAGLINTIYSRLTQVNAKWTTLKQAVSTILNEIGSNIEDLPDDFVSVSEEEVEFASEKVHNLVPELLKSQREIAEALDKKSTIIETSHFTADAEQISFTGATHADFLAWVLSRSHTCLRHWELTPAIFDSVRKVYGLARELIEQFEIVPVDPPDTFITSLSNMTEVYLASLVNTPLEHLRPVQALLLKRTSVIQSLGKAATDKLTKRQEQLQEQVEKLNAELEKEKKYVEEVKQLYANEARNHTSLKAAQDQLAKEKLNLEKELEDLKSEKALLGANIGDLDMADIAKRQRSLQAEQSAKLSKYRGIIIKGLFRGCLECLNTWKQMPRCDNKYVNPSVYENDELKLVKLALVHHNPLLHAAATQGVVSEKPMSEFTLLKLAAEILLARMTKEYPGADTLPQFTLEYLTEKHKSREVALKQIRQMIPTLSAFDDDNYFGTLLARLFQVKNPLSHSLTSFFVRANYGMHKFIQKSLEEKAKKSTGKRVSTDIDPMSGGIIFLCDALSLIYELKIDEDPNVCRRLLNHLRDPGMDKTDYVTFIINHRLEWLKIDTEQFFYHIDPSNKGVEIEFLINTILDKLKLCVSRKKLNESFRSKVDRNRSGNIGKEEFNVYMDVTYYSLNAAYETYSVSRNDFLSIICEVYDMTVEDLITKVKAAFIEHAASEHGLQAALQVLLPAVPAEELASRVADLLNTLPNSDVSFESFITFLAAREVQGLFVKPFGKCYVVPDAQEESQVLRERKRSEFFSSVMSRAMLSFAKNR